MSSTSSYRAPSCIRWRGARESAALEADAAHLLTDVYTSFGVAGGLLLVQLTGIEWIDPVAAMAVAGLIVHTGYRLVVGSTRVLLDETLEPEELEEIRRCIKDHKGTIIAGYHRLRARKAGSRRHIDLHITVDESLTVGEAHDVAEHIERRHPRLHPERRRARAHRAALARAHRRLLTAAPLTRRRATRRGSRSARSGRSRTPTR